MDMELRATDRVGRSERIEGLTNTLLILVLMRFKDVNY